LVELRQQQAQSEASRQDKETGSPIVLHSKISSLQEECAGLRMELQAQNIRVPTPPEAPAPSGRRRQNADNKEVRRTAMLPLVRAKADATDVIQLHGQVDSLQQAMEADKEQFTTMVDALSDLVEHKAERGQLEAKMDRLEVFTLLDAIVKMEQDQLATDGETFLSASQLIASHLEGKQTNGGSMCLSCKRPLDSLSRTLAEVVAHQTFHPVRTASGARTARVTKRALHDVETTSPSDSSPRVQLSRTMQQADRYRDGKASTQTLTMPRQVYENEVERYKAAQKAKKTRPPGTMKSEPLSINPVLRTTESETPSGQGEMRQGEQMSTPRKGEQMSTPRKDNSARGVRHTTELPTSRATGFPPVKKQGSMPGIGLPVEVSVGPASIASRSST